MKVFYKGENIALELALFSDSDMESAIKLDNFSVDVVLYPNGASDKIHCSTSSGHGVVPLVVSDQVLRCVIPKGLLESMQCGVFVVEVRLVDKKDKTSRIVKQYAFSLEDTTIKDL